MVYWATPLNQLITLMYYCLPLKRNPGITVLESEELTRSLHFSVLLLHSKLPQIYWLKTIAIYYITSLWIRNLTWFFTQGLTGLNQSISQVVFLIWSLVPRLFVELLSDIFHVVPTSSSSNDRPVLLMLQISLTFTSNFKGYCNYIEPTQEIQYNLYIWRSAENFLLSRNII